MKHTFQVDEITRVGVHNVSWGQWQISVNGVDVPADTERFGSMSCNLKFAFPDGRAGSVSVRPQLAGMPAVDLDVNGQLFLSPDIAEGDPDARIRRQQRRERDLVRSIAWGARFFVLIAVLHVVTLVTASSSVGHDQTTSTAQAIFGVFCWYSLCALYMWGCARIARRSLVFGAGLTLAFWIAFTIYWNVNATGASLLRYAFQVYLLWIAWRVVKKAIDLRAERNNLPTFAGAAS